MLFSRSSRFSRFSTPIRFSCAFFASMASLLVAAPQSARAQAKQAVAPNSLTNVEGNSSSTLFFNSAGLSFQQQIAASELTNFTANGSQITGFSVRLNGGAAAITADGSFDSYQITLSQAANSIANISTTYANNIVNPVTVYNRALSIPASSFSSGSAAGVANAFGATFTFDTAYTYRGGDLVMTVNKSARTGAHRLTAWMQRAARAGRVLAQRSTRSMGSRTRPPQPMGPPLSPCYDCRERTRPNRARSRL